MSRKDLIKIVPLLLVILLLWGCEPSDPGSPVANMPPSTRIVVAPMEGMNHDHYVSPSPMFYLQWFGNDEDGLVEGFYVQIDDDAERFTTRGDSVIAFESPDPLNPTEHVIKVTAIDNEGARDPNPPLRTFMATNKMPEITSFIASFPDMSVVGQGIAFEVEWDDPNISGAFLRVTVDGEPVSDWSERMKFQFCDISDPSILAGIDTDETVPINFELLPVGDRTLGVEVIDWGGAVGESYSRTLTVQADSLPELVTIESIYGALDYYPDGSTFYRTNTTTYFTLVGDASDYFGSIHSFRYHYQSRDIGSDDDSWSGFSDWSDWTGASFERHDLPPGEYQFEAECRDWTGVQSSITTYLLTIVVPDLNAKTILIVDETRDGNGNPGSPDDEQVDAFYHNILGVDMDGMTPSGWKVSELDYSILRPDADGSNYVSPLDVYNKRVIIWHGDDKSEVLIANSAPILGEYLERGGKLILSGQNILGTFAGADVATFTTGFPYKYLRIAAGSRSTERNTTGGFVAMLGDVAKGYPDTLSLDADKISGRWKGLDQCWTMTPRHRTDVAGYWHGYVPDTEWEALPACILNFDTVNPWRTITLGFPLYFMKNDEAAEFMAKALIDIDAD